MTSLNLLKVVIAFTRGGFISAGFRADCIPFNFAYTLYWVRYVTTILHTSTEHDISQNGILHCQGMYQT